MNKETINIVLAITQIFGSIALIVYVIKTWHIASATRRSAEISEKTLQEMKAARDQEVAPYVLAYFDLPFSEHVIHLVIKNVGKTVATNVRIEFEPKLIGIREEDFSTLPLIKDGIPSLPPGGEIKTFFDTAMSMFGDQNKRPLTYRAKIRYFGGLNEGERMSEQTLDLSVYKGLSSISRHGMHELVERVEKVARYTENISKELTELTEMVSDGINLRNPSILISQIAPSSPDWHFVAFAKLLEFKHTWLSTYGTDHDKMLNPFPDNLKLRLNQIGEQLVIIAANGPHDLSVEIKDSLLKISNLLIDLANERFYIDGGASLNRFDAKGNDILSLVNAVLQKFETLHNGPAHNNKNVK